MRKVNPSAAPILILALTSQDAAAERDLRRRRQRDRAAHLPGRRRRRGHRQRRRAAGDPRPGQSGRRSPRWASAWRTCGSPSPTPTRSTPLGTFDGPDFARTIGTNDQLRTPRDYEHDRGQDRQRHGGAARRHRHDRAERAQQPLGRLVQRAAVGAADHHQAGRRQRHRDGRPHPRAAAGAQALDSGRHRDLDPVRPHHDDPRQRARHAAHAARHHRAGDAGGVPVPAPRWRRRSPPASPCRCRSPAPARRCGWSASRSTTSR